MPVRQDSHRTQSNVEYHPKVELLRCIIINKYTIMFARTPLVSIAKGQLVLASQCMSLSSTCGVLPSCSTKHLPTASAMSIDTAKSSRADFLGIWALASPHSPCIFAHRLAKPVARPWTGIRGWTIRCCHHRRWTWRLRRCHQGCPAWIQDRLH